MACAPHHTPFHSGHALAELVQQRAAIAGERCVKAKTALWGSHVELMALVQQAANAVLQATP